MALSKRVKRGDLNRELPFLHGETTISLDKPLLKTELLKRSPDKGKMARRILLTFVDRKKMINEKTRDPRIVQSF